MKSHRARTARPESGATAIEYALIATLIGVAIIAGATALGGSLNSGVSGAAEDVYAGGMVVTPVNGPGR